MPSITALSELKLNGLNRSKAQKARPSTGAEHGGEDTEYSKLDAVSYDGSSYIFTSDAHVIGSIPGIDEEWGLMTQKGNDGANGVTPHIGDNGDWHIGSTDTGKPSRGEAGKTPVRGTDYWTEADKQEIVTDVLAALPDGTEVAY